MKVEFTYMSKDGRTPIHAVRWIPESGRCRAILQIVHGMTEFIERYAPFAEYLAAHDFLVVGHDLIGHGQSVLTREDWGYIAPGNGAKILIQDIHQLRLNIQRANKGVPYFMLGHSMGSFLVRRYISSRAKGLRRCDHHGYRFYRPSCGMIRNPAGRPSCKGLRMAPSQFFSDRNRAWQQRAV